MTEPAVEKPADPDGSLTPAMQAARALLEVVFAGISGAAVVGVAECAILVVEARDRFASASQIAGLPLLAAGNLLPCALLAAIVFTFADRLHLALRTRLRRPRLVVALAAGLATIPYAIPVARFAFSGPRAHAMAHRPLLEVAFGAVVCIGFAVLVGAALVPLRTRSTIASVAGGATAFAAAAAWLGRNALANEYEMLHELLAVGCVALATLAGRTVARAAVSRLRHVSWRIAGTALFFAGLASLAAVVVLARAQSYAWIVWRETGASRYLTHRFQTLAPDRAQPADDRHMVLRPRVGGRDASKARAERAAQPAPDIVIFSIDGLRRDHVGAYGYTRHPTTPNLDRFAKRGVVFENAVSSYPATQVFNSSLLLGRWVGKLDGDQQPRRFRNETVTRLLRDRGYRSFVKSWLEHSSRNKIKPESLAIDTYIRKSEDKANLEGPMEDTLGPLRAHLAEADAAHAPVFVWMHLLGTHPVPGGGFDPDPAFTFGDARMDRYDSAIAGSDAWLPHVERLMSERADRRPTIWILCSDHGTNSATASRDLYDGVVRVPLIVVAPGFGARTEGGLVDAAIDLAATVVDLAGIAPPKSYDGVSLVPLLDGEESPELASRIVPLAYNKLAGAIFGDFKLVVEGDGMALFDRGTDPSEHRNVVDEHAGLAARMRQVAEGELERRREDSRRARR